MPEQTKLILIGVLSLTAILIVVFLIINSRKTNINKDIEELNVRFNTIKTVPLAFKLNKAQAMAKRNDSTSKDVQEYYQKYEEAQKNIDKINSLFENIEDLVDSKDYKAARVAIDEVKEHISLSEKEVADIDKFLEQFSLEESDQRESSAKLKEAFREIKLFANENTGKLNIASDGISKKIEVVEDLFSQSEEFMYTNNYSDSQDCLIKIEALIDELKTNLVAIPALISETKGVIPTLLDEVNRQYALTRQRGVYIEHLKIDSKLEEINQVINSDIKTLANGDIENIEENNTKAKETLNELLEILAAENEDFSKIKGISDEVAKNLADLKNLQNYVTVAYEKDKDRFGLDNMGEKIEVSSKTVNEYQANYIALSQEIADNTIPASTLKEKIDDLLDQTNELKKVLAEYKVTFDKNTTDELRAKTQLIKLQVVLNEVEVKVLEYHLPTIANSYKEDLQKGRDKITKIKSLLNEVPLNIDELNETLDDAIDFVYKFYNNVNNIVGMAIMVENAIVFGNKYRSTYPEVERDLSKAEFSYLNGEYTKALTMAIACMEKLFPNSNDTNYLENA